MGSQKKRLNETLFMSTKLINQTGDKTYSQFYTQNYVHMDI